MAALHVQGTQRGAALGFKLDTLLKLADVKGTDRRTSLLHWVVQYLLKQDPDFKDMPSTLRATVPAAGVQVCGELLVVEIHTCEDCTCLPVLVHNSFMQSSRCWASCGVDYSG